MSLNSKIHAALNTTINDLLKQHGPSGARLMDIGCWDGETTLTYGKTVNAAKLIGIECMPDPAAAASSRGIEVIDANLESDIWNLESSTLDVVVCNQVFEHLKNIFLPFDEIARVLKTDGILIISVPNLTSFHNRCMLMLGQQPSSIRIWGPHVRGFGQKAFTAFCLTDNLFELIAVKGVGFYPFDPQLGGNLLANVWKSASHTPVWVLRRTARRDANFRERYLTLDEQTLI